MERLSEWFRSPPGRLLAEQERCALERCVDELYVRQLLLVGGFGDGARLQLRDERVRQWIAAPPGEGPADFVMASDQISVQAESVDVLVLVHALDYSDNPHQVLREAEQVLAPEGCLMILGFNPFSLWGLSRYGSVGGGLPRARQNLSQGRLRDWLTLLDLKAVTTQRLLFRPPWGMARLQHRLQSVERYGPRVLPWIGGAYLTVAKKRVQAVRPLRPAWRRERQPRLLAGLQPSPRIWPPAGTGSGAAACRPGKEES